MVMTFNMHRFVLCIALIMPCIQSSSGVLFRYSAEALQSLETYKKALDTGFGKESFRLLSRNRREDSPVSISEDVVNGMTSDVVVFNLNNQNVAKPLSDYSFQIVSASGVDMSIFGIRGNELKILASSPTNERDKFDREKNPIIRVTVEATKQGEPNSGQKMTFTVVITLTEVNDEDPVIVNPQPYQATVSTNPSPGTVVYTVTATDADLNSLLRISPTPGSSPRFTIQPTGNGVANIVTSGSGSFTDGDRLSVTLQVEDRNSSPVQKVSMSITVTVGQLAPQFYSSSYTGQIYENSADQVVQIKGGGESLVVRLIQFQAGNQLTYQVSDNNFILVQDPADSTRVTLRTRQAYDYENIQSISMTITVSEAGTNFVSTSTIDISIIDENDSAPKFVGKSQYFEQIKENAQVGTSVFRVSATDEDSGENGDIIFSIVGTEAFEVETIEPQNNDKVFVGVVKVKSPQLLDYEDIKTIDFSVMAMDGGNSPRSSTVAANVNIMNVNDNAPNITSDIKLQVPSSAPAGYVVVILAAADIDGDNIKFYLRGPSGPTSVDETGIFSIEEQSGRILLNSAIPNNRDVFDLDVVTVDDGSCCEQSSTQSSTISMTVTVEDANRNKPNFVDCRTYDDAQVLEKAAIGTFVVTVSAQDLDRGENGIVLYDLVGTGINFPFTIDENTGNITVKQNTNLVRTRGIEPYIQVTVRGKNKKTEQNVQQLVGYCTFRISIVDINDHAPRFEKNQYQFSYQLSSTIPATIARVMATDEDFGENANIIYSLTSDANTAFKIQEVSGAILLEENVAPGTYSLTVIANDQGKPTALTGSTSVQVAIDAGSIALPSWVNPPAGYSLTIDVKEDSEIDKVLATFQCTSNSPDNRGVEFRVFDTTKNINEDSEFFKSSASKQTPDPSIFEMDLLLRDKLSFFDQQTHSVTAACLGFNVGSLRARDIVIQVNVVDTNSEPPRLVGLTNGRYEASVPENAPSGTKVRDVSARDNDFEERFKQLTFSLGMDDAQYFTISSEGNTNEATVKTNQKFDREIKDSYSISIKVSDGTFEDSRTMIVEVLDVNDKEPQFNKTSYTVSVPETAEIGQIVMQVTATDEDSIDTAKGLEYQFTSGNTGNTFTIVYGSGEIRVARKLDYESVDGKEYKLKLVAYDDNREHTASTSVTIKVTDMNDNPPTFSQNTYEVIDLITEEQDPPPEGTFLVKVQAIDEDLDRTQTDITYSLAQQEDSNLFRVDSKSGDVYLIGKLDRDGPAAKTYVTIRAADEPVNPLYSYADVSVLPIDINDNKPEFVKNQISFTIEEHSPRNSLVGSVLARDIDAGDNSKVEYRKASVQTSPQESYFTVSIDGKITTNVAPIDLDYETFSSVKLMVEAFDKGVNSLSSQQEITITLKDINDNEPYFEKDLYRTTMSEATERGEILRVKAMDDDTLPSNRDFSFTFLDDSASSHFLVNTDNDFAVISVNPDAPIDYETDPKYYKFPLQVSDGDPQHTATTQIEIFVTDFNDNAPVFEPSLVTKTIVEGEPKGAVIVTFTATDIDDGINKQFEYSIDPESDPFFEFYADPTSGEVKTRKVLDRELADTREIIVWAIDKGIIPLTGSATLSLTLTDINDNAPVFAEDYRPVVPENEDNNNRLVVTISATDPDTPKYGAPFGFELPSGCTLKACSKFFLEYDGNGDGGKGTATIRTSSRFDREEQKEYHLPIVMWDMNTSGSSDSQTGTSTLTITIGDKNDNKHSPGHQEITFYNFDGKFGEVVVGRVYAEDADDFDVPDKTFTYVSPELYTNYFSVDSNSGFITIEKGVPESPPNEPYEFKVNVFDKVFGNTEECTVAVTVKALTDEALRKAGSMRLKGITAEEFIAAGGPSKPGVPAAPSKMHKFRTEMARLLSYPGPENIDVVSLTNGQGYLDVRFAGHSSPYVTPSQMESAVMLNMNSVQKNAGIQIDQVPVNLCMEEKYLDGCYTDLAVSGQPQVINGDGNSLTTMAVNMEAKDGCPDIGFPDPVECQGDYCFNGGKCIKDDWGNLGCECLPGFDGPRCQQRRHNFDGNSAAFYAGLSACAEGRTSIEFITLNADGLIMYSGPITNIDPDNSPQDYLILELKSGFPQLRLNLGVGEIKLQIDGKNDLGELVMPQLNDGQWHKLDIYKDNQDVILTVDNCGSAAADMNGTVTDWTPCLAQGRVPGGDILLNIQSLLQLGGRYPRTSPPTFPSDIPTKGFTGCMRNLFHNSKLYDLYYKPVVNWNSGKNGCPREERICGEGTGNPGCGNQERAHCQSRWQPESVESCTCHPGWYGNKCSQVAPIMDLRDTSFFQWNLTNSEIDNAERTTSVQLKFRSRKTTGTLFVMYNAKNDKVDLQLEDSKLVLYYNVGQGEKMLELHDTTAADGAWHVARFERHGSEFQMTMDGGEGRLYTYHQFEEDADVIFKPLSYISAGARVPTQANPTLNQISNDLTDSCIQDVRFNGKWLPMTPSQNNIPGVSLLRAPNTVEGCTREDCAAVSCSDGRFCYPLWGAHECRCVAGFQENTNGVCVSSCVPNPCFNDVPCSIVSGQVQCTCPEDFTGQYCNIGSVSEGDSGLSVGAIAGIIIAIIVILILVIVLILFLRTCRKRDDEKDVLEVDPDDDFIRENVMFYDEEGAGEEDHEAYDITLLQKSNAETLERPRFDPAKEEEMRRRNEPRLDRPDVGSFIDSRIRDTENDDDPFRDVPLEFNYEGGNSDAGSLSSLNTSSSGGSQDYDYLNDWGPKFARLADMYGAGQNFEA